MKHVQDFICFLMLILKATDSNMNHHVRRRRSLCGDKECSAPRIKGNTQNVTLDYNSNTLKCRAVGNPPPTITWEKDGVRIDEMDKKFQIRTDITRGNIIKSRLTVTPQQVAVYTCIARNTVKGEVKTVRSKNYYVRLGKGAGSPHSNGEYPYSSTEEMCVPSVNISAYCSPYLDPARSVYTKDGIRGVRRLETILDALRRNLIKYRDLRDDCRPHVRPFLCYYNFPYCDENTDSPEKVIVCRQDCVRLSRGQCNKEFQRAKIEDTIKTVIPHDCSQLPDNNCIQMQDEVRKTDEKRKRKNKVNPNLDPDINVVDPADNCFFNKGDVYRGTINRSGSGLSCKRWNRYHGHDTGLLLKGHNYCRNINNERERPWCYVEDPKEWEYCDVPECATPLRTPASNILYTIIPCLVFALVLSLAIIMVAWKRHKQHYYQSAPTSPKQVVPRVNPKIQELNREDLCDFRLLGDGCIGRVYTADFTGCKDGRTYTACVAVKAIIEKATQKQIEDFVREAETRGNFKHENVVALVGVISKEEPLSLVYEYTEYGDLHEYLLRHSPNFSEAHANDNNGQLEYPDLLLISTQIASGMSYLSTHAFVHKDLAARNCLVTENGCIKISDFSGLRDLYAGDYYRACPGRPPLPVRWMSPEAISSSCFTSASDVWSYGIVLWEIFSYGSRPLFGLSNYQAMKVIADHDLLLPSPEDCSVAIFNTMKECWAVEPDARPTFVEIYNRLKAMDDITMLTNSIPRQEELSLPSLNGTLGAPSGEYARGDVAVNEYVRGNDVGVNASAYHRASLSNSQPHSLHSGQSSAHSTGSGQYPGSIQSASHSIPPSLLSVSHSVPSSCMMKKMGAPPPSQHGHYPIPPHGDGRQSLPRDLSRDSHCHMGTRERGCGRPSSANSANIHRSPGGGGGVVGAGHSTTYLPPASYISSLHSYPTSVGCPPTMFSRQSSSRLSSRDMESSGYDSITRNNQSSIPHVYL